MNKSYEPKSFEDKIYKFWEDGGYFSAKASKDKKPFSIVMPPPNITGQLHMGHALNNTIQDVLTRFKRMQGFETLWLPGTDHASIATEVKIIEKIEAEGKTKKQLGREGFLKEAYLWNDKYGSRIVQQLKKLGASADWARLAFTMDSKCSRAVLEAFVRLYNKGLIYRGDRMINYCPECKTAVSDAEVEHSENEGNLWYIRYPLSEQRSNLEVMDIAESPSHLTVATTRPETMLGDVAVAVNPKDSRYKALIGKEVSLPLTNRKIPIIADSFVDKDFGTGAVKITPAHDPNDFEIGLRHNLPRIVIFDQEAKINLENSEYHGLDRFTARTRIVADLEKLGLLEKVEKRINNIGHCYRCESIIEPMVSLEWFVKMQPLAKPAIEAVKSKKIKFIPQKYEKTYMHWMENIKDWCISRNLWWGHRIPAYYCEDCGHMSVGVRGEGLGVRCEGLSATTTSPAYYSLPLSTTPVALRATTPSIKKGNCSVATSPLIPNPSSLDTPSPVFFVCEKCNGKMHQDEAVLDTWFSSALWPFSTLGWPDKTVDLDYFYPTTVLVTAYDIIFFWVARMIFSGLEYTEKVPFSTVYINGLVRDANGKKMSKSAGNGIDPLDIIDKYGTDSLRFSLLVGTSSGGDQRFSEEKIESAKNFMNKLHNAAKFVLMHTCKDTKPKDLSKLKLSIFDKWILSKLNEAIVRATKSYEKYEAGLAATSLYEFAYFCFCDWYIEFAKVGLRNSKTQTATKAVLDFVLDSLLKLLHPLIPFITEEIYQNLPNKKTSSIMIDTFPKKSKSYNEEAKIASASIEAIKDIRAIRAKRKVPQQTKTTLYILANEGKEKIVESCKEYIAACSSSRAVVVGKPSEKHTQITSEFFSCFLLESELAEQTQDKSQIEKDLKVAEFELSLASKKLSNPGFISKAPKELIKAEKEKVEKYRLLINKLKESL